ncbi:MAG: sulfite exporter TauE/SafE family protein, partial [Acidobacteria bacterium]|nr:sulfite exporter TauE/SafE family protein [Acidobacteriota bacterium]MDW7985227.1 sulfite exporter TauE/SafE family protein [Acidobacteriota bacterium]
YGTVSMAFLLSLGLPPAIASASVHTAEVFTSGVSGLFHWRLGNVDWGLFRRLVVPGVLGGILGAYVLTVVPGHRIRPFVAAYLTVMGGIILWRTLREPHRPSIPPGTGIPVLGFVGGFLDALGGGGWGPIVASTLVARGNHPRFTVGSVNLAEFFVTVAQAATFLAVLRLTHGQVVLGLIAGGVMAAPVAAYLARRLPTRLLMGLVGGLVVVLSLRVLIAGR